MQDRSPKFSQGFVKDRENIVHKLIRKPPRHKDFGNRAWTSSIYCKVRSCTVLYCHISTNKSRRTIDSISPKNRVAGLYI